MNETDHSQPGQNDSESHQDSGNGRDSALDRQGQIDNFLDFDDFSPRIPVLLLLDLSTSMCGLPIAELNEGFRLFLRNAKDDCRTNESMELEVITFNNSVEIVLPFRRVSGIEENDLPFFTADGQTCMGNALMLAEKELRERMSLYRKARLHTYTPWIVLMTDGTPTDEWMEIAEKMHKMCNKRKFNFIGIGIGNGVNWDVLKRIVSGPLFKIRDLKTCEFFHWLAKCVDVSMDGYSFGFGAEHFPSAESWAE